MECGIKLSKMDLKEMDSTLFKSLVVSLRYVTCTRSNISFAVGLISRFMKNLANSHMKAAKRILYYLKGTLDYGLFYSSSKDFKLMSYYDCDFVGDLDDRKSTTDFIFFLGDHAISWSSKKQSIVILSTCESEYITAISYVCHAIWLRRLLKELYSPHKKTTKILIDNKSAQALAKNSVYHD